MTGPKGEKKIVQDAIYLGGMCAECEGRGTVSDLDLSVILDESKSLAEGAILVPGYTADGWMVATFIESGFFDPKKPIREYTERERHDLLYKQTTRIKAKGIPVVDLCDRRSLRDELTDVRINVDDLAGNLRCDVRRFVGDQRTGGGDIRRYGSAFGLSHGNGNDRAGVDGGFVRVRVSAAAPVCSGTRSTTS